MHKHHSFSNERSCFYTTVTSSHSVSPPCEGVWCERNTAAAAAALFYSSSHWWEQFSLKEQHFPREMRRLGRLTLQIHPTKPALLQGPSLPLLPHSDLYYAAFQSLWASSWFYWTYLYQEFSPWFNIGSFGFYMLSVSTQFVFWCFWTEWPQPIAQTRGGGGRAFVKLNICSYLVALLRTTEQRWRWCNGKM